MTQEQFDAIEKLILLAISHQQEIDKCRNNFEISIAENRYIKARDQIKSLLVPTAGEVEF